MKAEESTYTTMSEIRAVMELAAKQMDFPLEELDKIEVSFNSRFTRRMGDANFRKMRIRFSEKLWPLASLLERRETIVHELCHIVDRYFGNMSRRGHGPSWKLLMNRCGYAGDRCHNVDRGNLKRRNKGTKEYFCACGAKHFLGKKRSAKHERLRAIGRRGYSCTKCKDQLTRSPYTKTPIKFW